MRIHMLNSKIIHIQVYQVAKGGWQWKRKVRHVWPTDSHRWTDKIKHFFFLSRAFWKIEGWSSSDRSPPASSSTKFTIESPGEEGTRGVMERALATGETWREGRRVFLGLVCINFRYGTTSCRIVSLSLSSSRVRRAQSGSHSLSLSFSMGYP